MDFPNINYLAVLVAALAMFVIGAAWYTPLLFAKAWMKELGLKKEDFAKQNMLKTFGGSFLLMLVMSFNLAAFFGPEVDWKAGMIYGALTGIGWVAAAIGINYIYERRSFKIWLINAGYMAVSFTVMGAILGAWH